MSKLLAPMSIKLDPSLRDRLSSIALKQKRTAHAVAREAIEQLVAETEAKDALAKEAQEAWEHYQETGLHLTLEEVGDSMTTWGTDNEKPIPKCHV